MSTLWTWLIPVAAIVALALLVAKYLHGRGRRVATVRLTASREEGVWTGAVPRETAVVVSTQLCLMWACKVRWLLISEPLEARLLLNTVVERLGKSLADGSSEDLERPFEHLRSIFRAFGMGRTPPGATLSVSLYYTGHPPLYWMLTNSLPSGGTIADLILSVAYLVRSAVQSLDPANRQVLGGELSQLAEVFATSEADDPSMSGLQRLFVRAYQLAGPAGVEAVRTQVIAPLGD